MRKMASGFGGTVPCNQVTTTGKLRFYVIFKDQAGDPVMTVGRLKSPLEITIKNKIDGEQPALPGKKPPKKCTSVECPPDFPGCKSTGPAKVGWGGTCKETSECRDGLACTNGSCEKDESGDGGDSSDGGSSSSGGSGSLPKNLVSLAAQLDVLAINSAENVCGRSKNDGSFTTEHDNYFCFNSGDGGEYLGIPSKDKFNEIQGGAGIGFRLLAGYTRVFGKGLSAGVRVGYALTGSPSIGDAAERYDACKDANGKDACREPAAQDFFPWHAEVRFEYFFLESKAEQWMKAGKKYLPRPYAFLGTGFGQVNSGVTLSVCDTVDDAGNPVTADQTKCPANTTKRDDVEAYQITGLNFVDFGIGGIFPVHKNFGVQLELKFMVMLPTSGFVFAPVLGPVAMF